MSALCAGCGRYGTVYAQRETVPPIRHVRVRVCPPCWDRGWRLTVASETDQFWALDPQIGGAR